MFPAVLSNSDITFVIRTQDGRTYTFTIPSTGGQLKINPQMLSQNIKDLLLQYSLTSTQPFALFPSDFTIETKAWQEPTYIDLAVFLT